MTRFILSIYSFLRRHRWIGIGIFLLSTIALVLSLLTLRYNEDISEFLPMDAKNRESLEVYQQVSGAGKIIALVSLKDTASNDAALIAEGIRTLTERIEARDTIGAIRSVMSRIDMEGMMEIADEVYDDIPLFLTPSDYQRIDSLLNIPGYAEQKMKENREILLFPTGSMLAQNISRDPLGLFTDVMPRLSSGNVGMQYESYDGYILTPDEKNGLVVIESAFGANESEHNAALANLLTEAAGETESVNPDLEIRYVGGPVIAVGNASRIKKDSILAIAIAGVLIISLLLYAFRSVRSILLILISIGWGWLFAMGIIALFYDSISIIVIGISSIILGIAVNYPLHLIDHFKTTPDMRTCLREIVGPLAVGNITTVGAFLCLVPLNATALHDLGLFSSLLLVGTIIFVLIFLPHLMKSKGMKTDSSPNISSIATGTETPATVGLQTPTLISKIAGISIEKNRWIIYTIFTLTCVFAVFALRTEFDSDIRNINYLSPQQREDLDYLSHLTTGAEERANGSDLTEQAFVVSRGASLDLALQNMEKILPSLRSMQEKGELSLSSHVLDFIHSTPMQKERLKAWSDLISSHPALLEEIRSAGSEAGFSADAFEDFEQIWSKEHISKKPEDFGKLNATIFAANTISDPSDNSTAVVLPINLPADSVETVMNSINAAIKNAGAEDAASGDVVNPLHPDNLFAFDVKGMNASLTNTLSDDFNYIGVACSLIVFIFLWISLGSIELALISFIPMAISWIWILGIMAICGIKFNIVNIILATFIFGQGDDYTIFMTEGLTYEFAYRKKMLDSFKNSIIISALIMFIGIGTLVIADHPAMKSLGEVTVVGMVSVVLMAYFFPPFIFHWLVKTPQGKIRRFPFTLSSLWRKREKGLYQQVFEKYLYKGREVEMTARRNIRAIRKEGLLDSYSPSPVIMLNLPEGSQGELALLLALKYPESEIRCSVAGSEQRDLLSGCCEDFVDNITIINLH